MQMMLDYSAGQRRKYEGMRRAEDAAGLAWNAAALDAVRQVCESHRTFTSDDIWLQLGTKDLSRENRALGPVMRRAAGLGYCQATDRVRPTAQANCHGSPARIWNSMLFMGD